MSGKIFALICLPVFLLAGFDWGNGEGTCSGSGSFTQPIAHDDTINVGNIVADKTGVVIKLLSDEDVDIQIWDGNKAIGDGIPGTQYQFRNCSVTLVCQNSPCGKGDGQLLFKSTTGGRLWVSQISNSPNKETLTGLLAIFTEQIFPQTLVQK